MQKNWNKINGIKYVEEIYFYNNNTAIFLINWAINWINHKSIKDH